MSGYEGIKQEGNDNENTKERGIFSWWKHPKKQ